MAERLETVKNAVTALKLAPLWEKADKAEAALAAALEWMRATEGRLTNIERRLNEPSAENPPGACPVPRM